MSIGIEDSIFARARLGRHYTEDAARACNAWFGPAPYRFDIVRELRFIATHQTDYCDNLRYLLRGLRDDIRLTPELLDVLQPYLT